MTDTETTPRRTFLRRPRLPRRPRVSYLPRFSGSLVLGRAVGILLHWPHLILPAALPPYLLILAPELLGIHVVPWTFPVLACIGFHLLVGFYAGPVGALLSGRRPGALEFLFEGSAAVFSVRFLAPALAVATLAGTILVVPGLFMLFLWFLAIPVAVREGLPARAAVRRSAELLAGAPRELFWCLLLIGFAGGVAQGIVTGLVTDGVSSELDLLLSAGSWFVPFALAALLPIVIYEELAG